MAAVQLFSRSSSPSPTFVCPGQFCHISSGGAGLGACHRSASSWCRVSTAHTARCKDAREQACLSGKPDPGKPCPKCPSGARISGLCTVRSKPRQMVRQTAPRLTSIREGHRSHQSAICPDGIPDRLVNQQKLSRIFSGRSSTHQGLCWYPDGVRYEGGAPREERANRHQPEATMVPDGLSGPPVLPCERRSECSPCRSCLRDRHTRAARRRPWSSARLP